MVREKELTQTALANITFIRLVLPAGEAVSAPPLSATLGQVQINSNDFCKQYNQASLNLFESGVLTNVHLFKNADGTFYFKIRGIFIPFLFFQAADDQKFIKLENLFDIFQFFCSIESSDVISSSAVCPTDKGFLAAKEFFGALRAMGFKIIFLNSISL